MQFREVPFFSQWESPDMTLPVLAEGPSALLRDPLWRNSGAETVEDYARWLWSRRSRRTRRPQPASTPSSPDPDAPPAGGSAS